MWLYQKSTVFFSIWLIGSFLFHSLYCLWTQLTISFCQMLYKHIYNAQYSLFYIGICYMSSFFLHSALQTMYYSLLICHLKFFSMKFFFLLVKILEICLEVLSLNLLLNILHSPACYRWFWCFISCHFLFIKSKFRRWLLRCVPKCIFKIQVSGLCILCLLNLAAATGCQISLGDNFIYRFLHNAFLPNTR